MNHKKTDILKFFQRYHKHVSQQETPILVHHFSSIAKSLASIKEELSKTLSSIDTNFDNNYTKDHVAEVISSTIENISHHVTTNLIGITYTYSEYATYKREIIKRGYQIEEIEEYIDGKKSITVTATKGDECIIMNGSEKKFIHEDTSVKNLGLHEKLKNGLIKHNITTMGEIVNRRNTKNKANFEGMEGLGRDSYDHLMCFLINHGYIQESKRKQNNI